MPNMRNQFLRKQVSRYNYQAQGQYQIKGMRVESKTKEDIQKESLFFLLENQMDSKHCQTIDNRRSSHG